MNLLHRGLATTKWYDQIKISKVAGLLPLVTTSCHKWLHKQTNKTNKHKNIHLKIVGYKGWAENQ